MTSHSSRGFRRPSRRSQSPALLPVGQDRRSRSASPPLPGSTHSHGYYYRLLRQYEGEEERRRLLTSAERLAEDRDENLRSFKDSDDEVLFQATPMRGRKPGCLYDDCLFSASGRRIISEEYRVAVPSLGTKKYYHVECFETMVDVEELLACGKFLPNTNAGSPPILPLMFCKWFAYKGHIDLDNISSFIDRVDAFEAEIRDFSTQVIEAQLRKDPIWKEWKVPQKPCLEDYIKPCQEFCKLSVVMKHRRSERLSSQVNGSLGHGTISIQLLE